MAANYYKKILELYAESTSNQDAVNTLLTVKAQTEDKELSGLISQTVSALLTQSQMSGCRLSAMSNLNKCNLGAARCLKSYCDRLESKEEWQVLCERNNWNQPSTSRSQWQRQACSNGYCPSK